MAGCPGPKNWSRNPGKTQIFGGTQGAPRAPFHSRTTPARSRNGLRWCRARFSRNTISPFRGILFSILGEKMSTFFPSNFFPGIKCRHFSPGIYISPPKLTFSRNNMSQRFPGHLMTSGISGQQKKMTFYSGNIEIFSIK